MGSKLDCEDAKYPPGLEREVIVIGSGFGGAVAACRLAQGGYKPLVLERGRRYESKDFPALPVKDVLVPDSRRWSWGTDQGLYDVVDLEEILTVQAAGYGGGSLIYANVHLKPPPTVFDDRWPASYRKPGALDEFFDLAVYMLGAAPIGAHANLSGQIVKAEQLGRAARQLGREKAFFTPPLTISSVEGPNAHGVMQHPCTGCGGCITGCPEGAKNTLDYNYLAVAEKNGAEVRTECEVMDIVQLGDGKWAVHCMDHLSAERLCFVTSYLFLCAGSLHSTRLLARAKLLPQTLVGGSSLAGIGYFPDGDTIGVVYDTKYPQYPSVGPTITTTTVHWKKSARASEQGQAADSFFLIQDGGYARELQRFVGMFRAPAWVGRNRVTTKSDGLVKPSKAPTLPPPAERKGTDIVPSAVDAFLDALKAGDLTKIPSRQLSENFPEFLKDLEKPLLLPAIVERTIETAMQERHARWFRCLSEKSWIRTVARRFERFLIRRFYGTHEALAHRAFRAIVTGANLDRNEIARQVMNYDAAGAESRTVLLGMGQDAASGVLQYDAKQDRLIADLDLFHLAPGYAEEEQLMADFARALGGELRTSPAWAFLGKPITVHSQGGCPMSEHPKDGVTTPQGQVHGLEGLYVMDGSILCSSVGVNPSATITAIAERNIWEFLKTHQPRSGRAGNGRAADVAASKLLAAKHAKDSTWVPSPPPPSKIDEVDLTSEPLGLRFREIMEGHYSECPVDPRRQDADYRRLEAIGRPLQRMKVDLRTSVKNLAQFFEDETHELQITGDLELYSAAGRVERRKVTGTLQLFTRRFKPYGIPRENQVRRAAQARFGRGYKTHVGRPRRFAQRYLLYKLETGDHQPTLRMEGYKRIRDDPGFDGWRDTSTLFFKLFRDGPTPATAVPVLFGAGAVHISMDDFIFTLLPSIEITGTEDPARITWATAKFGTFFFGTLQRLYAPAVGTALQTLFKWNSSNVRHEP
jgi:choline dehydrogenase-like flavoprotein